MRYPILFAMLTAVFWGLYGPALGQARSALMSPFKPYFAIGIAYVVWGVVGGLVGMRVNGEAFAFTGPGISWGFIAGTLGAWGAMTLTFAMFTGGAAMPHLVMPIVFGGAVTVTAVVSTASARVASPWMWLGILCVAIGIVLVAYNTPHAAPPSRPAGAPAAAGGPEHS